VRPDAATQTIRGSTDIDTEQEITKEAVQTFKHILNIWRASKAEKETKNGTDEVQDNKTQKIKGGLSKGWANRLQE
jgi:hypothetical protein